MNDILSEIIDHKQTEIEMQKQAVSAQQLLEQINASGENNRPSPRHSMKQALAASSTGIIAEFKRRSPSKGWIYQGADARRVPPAYREAGAAALSILTDEKYFGGSLRDLRTARPLVDIPILRKDFIIDEYQLLQASLVGADAILLIAACLTPERCAALTSQAHALGLEVLLEVHSPSELTYINKEIDMVGVNNRNLGTFVTDVENSFRIAGQLRQTIAALSTCPAVSSSDAPLLVSESGISHPETIRRLRSAGFRGFLIGETFMKTGTPGKTLESFISQITETDITDSI